MGWRLSELGWFLVKRDWMCHLLWIIIYSPLRRDLEKGGWLMISHFYPVQWFCHDREIHTDDSECRENTWNYPAFHSLLSLHSFHSQRVLSFQPTATPFPLSNHHFTPFTPFTPMPSFHPSISIPLHFNPHPFQSIYNSPTIHPLIHTPHQQPNSAATLTIPFVWS